MRAAGPVVDPVPCSGCGKLIDPLRAGHVAIFDHRFHFFCDAAVCRPSFLTGKPRSRPSPSGRTFTPVGELRGDTTPSRSAVATPREPLRSRDSPEPREVTTPSPTQSGAGVRPSSTSNLGSDRLAPRPPPAVAAPVVTELPVTREDASLPAPLHLGDDASLVEPIPRTVMTETPPRQEGAESRDMSALLLVISIISGSLAVLLSLAGLKTVILGARITLAAVAAAMLIGRAATSERDPADPHPAPLLAPILLAIPIAVWATLGKDLALASEAASLAGVVTTANAIGTWLFESTRRSIAAERAYLAAALEIPGRRAPMTTTAEAGELVFDLRPGERVIVEPGEDVPVDLTVTGGDVEVLPWLGAVTPVRRRDGDPVIAGAKVVSGRLLGVATFVGNDRALVRVLLDPRRVAHAHAPVARAARSLAERWAVAAAIVAGLASFVTGHRPIEIAMTVVAVLAGLSTILVGSLASVHLLRGVLRGVRRGITFRSADAWDRAGRASIAVFCARGTLLMGEPELVDVEAWSAKLRPEDVLAFAAGAERSERHPVANAIVRAARGRGVRPDGVRNPHLWPGLGVTAVTSTGEELVIGSRALLFERRISTATAEARIAELEASGRSVVLVGVGGRFAGLLALQDGLRPGARAAVQHLLDAGIEPVLLSGDSRETCEAIARALDIEHIRPEVLPQDRQAEVRRLVEGGATVAVLGHAGVDDPALGAADAAVALGAAGSTHGEFDVALASEDVRDAAFALALARRTRQEARAGLVLAAVPAALGAIVVAFGVLPAAYVPIASLVGGVMGALHGRALERQRNPPPPPDEAFAPAD